MFSITRIIGILLNNQLVLDEPYPCPIPCYGITEVLVYISQTFLALIRCCVALILVFLLEDDMRCPELRDVY